MTVVVELVDRYGHVVAEGRPAPDGTVTFHTDRDPPVGGWPHIRIHADADP